MDILLAVVVLAVAWHVGLTLLERSRYPRRGRPSLARLLLLAEADLLRTLRSELKRRSCLKRDSATDRKLLEVEGQLKELDDE